MYTEYLKTKLKLLASSKDALTSIDAGSALSWVTDHMERMEREHERLIKILEGMGIDTDEETLATLELIGTCDEYKWEREKIACTIMETMENKRETEEEEAIDALTVAGFELDEENDCWIRGHETVRIELVNGRESRYKWEYENSEHLQTGISGEFARLIELIQAREVKT